MFTGTKVHKCRECNNVLGKSKQILSFVEFLQDKIHTISIGEIAFVISRRLIMNILLCCMLLAYIVYSVTMTDPVQGIPSDKTWTEFKDQCGNGAFRELSQYNQKTSLASRCQFDHIGSTFQNWKGTIIRIHDNRNNYFDFFHSLKILMKMDPEDNKDNVDLVIDINFDKAKEMNDNLESLSTGMEIHFNATLKSLHVQTPNHVHLVDLAVTNVQHHVPDLLLTNSRFFKAESTKRLFHNGKSEKNEKDPTEERHEVPQAESKDV